jgi:hypothetical protein
MRNMITIKQFANNCPGFDGMSIGFFPDLQYSYHSCLSFNPRLWTNFLASSNGLYVLLWVAINSVPSQSLQLIHSLLYATSGRVGMS